MMKRISTVLVTMSMMVWLAACAGQTEPVSSLETETNQIAVEDEVSERTQEELSKETEEATIQLVTDETEEIIPEKETGFAINVEGITTTDELEVRIEDHLDALIASLIAREEKLFTEVDTYEKYNETDSVSVFYETLIDETNQMSIMLYEYSACYARLILDADMDNDDKYDAIKGIHDCLYEDACDEIHDEIYEGIMDDMKDYFYGGIIENAQEQVDYSEWYDISSEEYSQWYDTGAEIYSIYYDTTGDIYSFYYDMSGELYSGDLERAEEIYERFVKKIEKAKGNGSNDVVVSDVAYDTTIRDASSVEEVEAIVETHVGECIAALNKEWEDLSTEIDTYEKYIENVDRIEAFHIRVEDASAEILTMICQYGVAYTDLILQSDSSTDDMYDAFEGFKECIYDDACELVNDKIYDQLLEEVKDYYYDGIIDGAKESVTYSDWSDARSDAYGWWSDARGEVYSNWSDTRGDLYSYWLDVRGELYSDSLDDVKDKMDKFQKKISK